MASSAEPATGMLAKLDDRDASRETQGEVGTGSRIDARSRAAGEVYDWRVTLRRHCRGASPDSFSSRSRCNQTGLGLASTH